MKSKERVKRADKFTYWEYHLAARALESAFEELDRSGAEEGRRAARILFPIRRRLYRKSIGGD